MPKLDSLMRFGLRLNGTILGFRVEPLKEHVEPSRFGA